VRQELPQAPEITCMDVALADLNRLLDIGERVVVTPEIHPRLGPVVIELREHGTARAGGSRCVSFSAQLRQELGVGLFLIEDRSDVGDRAWWRDEGWCPTLCQCWSGTDH
jgi:hypothetical protein